MTPKTLSVWYFRMNIRYALSSSYRIWVLARRTTNTNLHLLMTRLRFTLSQFLCFRSVYPNWCRALYYCYGTPIQRCHFWWLFFFSCFDLKFWEYPNWKESKKIKFCRIHSVNHGIDYAGSFARLSNFLYYELIELYFFIRPHLFDL